MSIIICKPQGINTKHQSFQKMRKSNLKVQNPSPFTTLVQPCYYGHYFVIALSVSIVG